MPKITKHHKLEDAISRYSLNISNFSYIEDLVIHLQESHPLDFLRIQLSSIDPSQTKLPVSRYSVLYWLIRGYSEEEAKQKISEAQGKNGSFEEKRKKLANKGFSSDEIDLEIQKLSKKRGEINSESHRRAQEKDPTYLRSMSHHCPEFWIKKGFSEEESKIKAAEICEKNRKKFREKLDSGEIKRGWNNTTLEYYLKKGMSLDEAKEKLFYRQQFTLEKCIEKHGKIEGTRKWKERQEKWKNSIYSSESCITVGRSKISDEFISNFENITREFFMRTKEKCFVFDMRKGKKLIEFNGDFWHCNPEKYSSDYLHPVKNKSAQEIWDYDKKKEEFARSKGYNYLVIWESEYKLFPEETINKCKKFLNGNS
jgi:hypothetical protein